MSSRVPYLVGIDEAGRGPVLGSMVYGLCFCPVKFAPQLAKLGFADSKVLTAAQRDELFSTIGNTPELGALVDILSPEYLSSKMLARSRLSLNVISHNSAIQLVQSLIDKGIHIEQLYIDTVGDPGKYQGKLKDLFPFIQEIVVAKKADSLYPIVSAASIVAKVTRDRDLENWKFPEEQVEDPLAATAPSSSHIGKKRSWPGYRRTFGSGYPGDPLTKQWLTDSFHPIFGFPTLVRFSWQTCKKICLEQGIPIEWGDSNDDDENGENEEKLMKSIPKLESFFDRLKQTVESAGGGGGAGGGKKSGLAAGEKEIITNERLLREFEDSRGIPLRKRTKWFQHNGLGITTKFV